MKLIKDNNNYHTSSKKEFEGSNISISSVTKAFEFAYEMAFGLGHHREHRSGGVINRNKTEIFQNTFQGKIAEIIVYENLKNAGIPVEEPDFSISGKEIWDDTDLKSNEKSICIKSAAFFSNLLLLETKDWDNQGRYLPNINNKEATSTHDFFVLVRIKPNIKSMLNALPIVKELYLKEIQSFQWLYDIPGCCSIKTIQHIINNQYILPQNSILNKKTKMDAENYYIQTGNLRAIEVLHSFLKE